MLLHGVVHAGHPGMGQGMVFPGLCVADVVHARHPGMGAGHGLSRFVCC